MQSTGLGSVNIFHLDQVGSLFPSVCVSDVPGAAQSCKAVPSLLVEEMCKLKVSLSVFTDSQWNVHLSQFGREIISRNEVNTKRQNGSPSQGFCHHPLGPNLYRLIRTIWENWKNYILLLSIRHQGISEVGSEIYVVRRGFGLFTGLEP